MAKTALIAKITAAPGRRDEIAAALEPMFTQVGAEPGTEVYVMHDDDGDPDVIWMYELYTDAQAVEAHATSPAMMEMFTALGALVAGPPELFSATPRRAEGLEL